MASTLEKDDPRQSSAALCINLNLLGESFGPEFTHQCFEGEWIRGYQPKSINAAKATKHSSHAHHKEAKHELQISIKLSPSLRQCQVDAQVQRKPRDIVTRASKRQRLETNDAETENTTSPTSDEDDSEEQVSNNSDKDSDFEDSSDPNNESPANDDAAAPGTTRTRRMPVDEIVQRCSKALPTIVKEVSQDDDYLQLPLGSVVKEYTRNGMDFIISLANGADAAQYHNEVQKLAIWFIETADDVNLASSERGGYWKILYIFRKHAASQYSVVGYMTIFHFYSPFKKPTSGIVARVCQVLILPPYQRMGHGIELLKQVYGMAGDDIVEINVEDPAPSCTLLRNKLDTRLLQKSFTSKTPWLDSSYYSTTDISHPDFFKPISDADAIQAGAVACIIPRQVQVAHEIYKLSLLPDDCSEDVQKKYRLMVKKRLAKVHREDLGGCATKEEKQAMLAKIFDETLELYEKVLKKSSKSS